MIIRRAVWMNDIQMELEFVNEIMPQNFPGELTIINELILRNHSFDTLRRICLRFWAEPAVILPHCCYLPELEHGESFTLKNISLPVYAEKMGRIYQDQTVTLHAELIAMSGSRSGLPEEITAEVLTEIIDEFLIQPKWDHDIGDFFTRQDSENGRLNSYADGWKTKAVDEALGQKVICGYPAKEIIDTWRATVDYENIISFGGGMLKEDPEFFFRQRNAVEQLIFAGKKLGHPHGHPLCRIGQKDHQASGMLRERGLDCLSELHLLLDKMVQDAASFTAAAEIPLSSRDDWRRAYELSCVAESIRAVPSALSMAENFQEANRELHEYLQESGRAEQIREYLLLRWNESFFSAEEDEFDWLDHPLIMPFERVRFFRTHACSEEAKATVPQDRELLNRYRSLRRSAEQHLSPFPEEIRRLIRDGEADRVQDALYRLSYLEQQYPLDAKTFRKLLCSEVMEKAAGFRNSADTFSRCRRLLEEWLLPSPSEETDFIAAEYRLYEAAACSETLLQDWISWNAARSEAMNCGLHELVERYQNGLDHEAVLPSYLHALCNEHLLPIAQDPLLRMFLPELLYG